MYYYTSKTTENSNRIITIQTTISNKDRTHEKKEFKNREQSLVGSKSYRDALRRAFARAKLIAFFNPQLDTFITLTYAGRDHDPLDVIDDIKYLVKRHNRKHPNTPLQYIYVLEYQKRGSIHVHMVANNVLDTETNKNGYESLTDWKKGYSSVLRIQDTDANFRPYLYLFKYMSKAQRVGKSFIHTSKNFAKIKDVDYNKYVGYINEETPIHVENYAFEIDEIKHRIIKKYYQSQAN